MLNRGANLQPALGLNWRGLGRLCGVLGLLLISNGLHADKMGTAAEPFQLQELAWMGGSWGGKALGGEVEETWSDPSNDTMCGMFRLMAGGKTQVIEFLLITVEDDGIVFRFKHFGTNYETWEKDVPLIFDLVSVKPGEAVFESSVQDNPKRLIYRLDGDALTVTVEGMNEGRLESFDVPMTRRGP